MADVTISQLPDLTVNVANHLVHTDGTNTGKATVAALKASLALPNVTVSTTGQPANNVGSNGDVHYQV